MNTGMLYALSAYMAWGLFPIYFKSLHDIAPLEILLHRMVWALGFLLIVLAVRKQWAWISGVFRQPKVLAGFTASALLLSTNWFVYIWAVNHDRIVDASLGYFMTPLVNVLLGFLVLGERLRRLQWAAVAIAAIGVAWLTWENGHLPWISLTLGLTFGTYGLLRKTATLGALEGLSLETLLLFPLAALALTMMTWGGNSSFVHASSASQWLLVAAGPITAIPLLLFAAGARRIPLATLGLLQYITPTIQLLIGVWLYHEPFSGARLIGFATIWIALGLYSLDGVWQTYKRQTSVTTD
ncbi:EamA family transporter RarD [Herminiimonas arsenitoxidans]|uniref:EamA family transporter RarD n=1 Tax=Herminiimonas arsenitoxidans TaxID=1809410 RepID=UPI0009706746|nr:EamA family transporter RarD [Herminiimonas arsenitoxidans]